MKVEASNLTAFTRYYYQFNVCGSDKKSPLGRTKTTPDVNDYVSKVGLAVYSCSNYPFGFFNAYGNPARKDSVDYVLHLGDYIYEYAGDGVRTQEQSGCRTLSRSSRPALPLHVLAEQSETSANRFLLRLRITDTGIP